MRKDYNEIKTLQTPHDLFDMKGSVGVIMGGAGKMGREFARTLANAGATVVIADIESEKIDTDAQNLPQNTSGSIIGMACDVNSENQINGLFKSVSDSYGIINFFIYNVMAKPDGYYRPTDSYSIETWNEVLAGNLTGAFLCCREAEKYMKDPKGGSMVLTSSVYGIVGPDQRIYEGCAKADNIYGGGDPLNCPAAYSTSKAGLLGMARYFSTLWAGSGIRVNVLVPGGVYDDQETSFHDAYVQRTPLGRMAVWSDFNGAILFLVSDASRYMTGSQLVIDGGWTAW